MNAARWQRLKSLYDSAMDLSTRGRGAYLDRLRGGSLGMDLNRLLERARELDGFFEQAPFQDKDVPNLPAHALHPGDLLAGRYETGEFIGAGGMQTTRSPRSVSGLGPQMDLRRRVYWG